MRRTSWAARDESFAAELEHQIAQRGNHARFLFCEQFIICAERAERKNHPRTNVHFVRRHHPLRRSFRFPVLWMRTEFPRRFAKQIAATLPDRYLEK